MGKEERWAEGKLSHEAVTMLKAERWAALEDSRAEATDTRRESQHKAYRRALAEAIEESLCLLGEL